MLLGLEALVCAGLVDGGQHLAGDPVLEGLGLGHLAAQNQAVQAALVDEGGLSGTGEGVVFHDPSACRGHIPFLGICPLRQNLKSFVLVVNVLENGVAGILVPQCNGNVLADQPGRAVDLHGAHLPELGISECGQVVHGEYVPPYFRCVLI